MKPGSKLPSLRPGSITGTRLRKLDVRSYLISAEMWRTRRCVGESKRSAKISLERLPVVHLVTQYFNAPDVVVGLVVLSFDTPTGFRNQ